MTQSTDRLNVSISQANIDTFNVRVDRIDMGKQAP
jgi:hypothetical protein